MPNASAPKAPCVEVWRVAADDRHARLRDAQLGADHVDDALAVRAQRVDRHSELGAVVLERLDLLSRELVGDHLRRRGAVSRDVVVGRGERAIGPADLSPGEAEPVEGLGRGDLVDQVEVDVDRLVGDRVALPDLLEHCLGHR